MGNIVFNSNGTAASHSVDSTLYVIPDTVDEDEKQDAIDVANDESDDDALAALSTASYSVEQLLGIAYVAQAVLRSNASGSRLYELASVLAVAGFEDHTSHFSVFQADGEGKA